MWKTPTERGQRESSGGRKEFRSAQKKKKKSPEEEELRRAQKKKEDELEHLLQDFVDLGHEGKTTKSER